MLHWVPQPSLAFVGARDRGPAMPGDVDRCVQQLRAVHATMLAYAAQRRRAAENPADAHYWKAAEGHALQKARALRTNRDFPRLP
jgi:hypothetical protein